MNLAPTVRKLFLSTLIMAIVAVTTVHAQTSSNLKLWYNKPSGKVWENALPIGNGRLGAMIYGNVEKEVIQLNEHTLWSGSPNRNDNPLLLDSLGLIRSLIFDGKQKQAETLANKVIISKRSHGQMFEPAGELNLSFPDQETYSNYYRELDIERAITKTSYSVGDVKYTRETLASFPDRVIVMHLTADKPNKLSFTAYFTTPQPKVDVKTLPFNQLSFSGTTIDHEGVKGMVRYKGLAAFKTKGGIATQSDTSIVIKNANEVTIYISIATNFNNYHDISGDENERANSYLNAAVLKTFETIKTAHIAAYQKYFNRVHLDIGNTDASRLPTDERLIHFNSSNDPQFAALYFQFGRYLLISSSQPGGQPANLQGIWNNKLRPAWDSKYTININAEMNYWPAEKTNLSELHQPFIQMVRDLSEWHKRLDGAP